jgi:hypothetical protein
MSGTRVSLYREPKWGSLMIGEAQINMDAQGNYTLNDLPVASVHVVDLFSVLTCADGTTHVVFTAFLRLITPVSAVAP